MHMSVFRLFFIFSDGKQSLGIQGIFINYPLLFVSSWRRFYCCCCNSYGISYDASKAHLSPGPFISMPQSCCMPLPQIVQNKTKQTKHLSLCLSSTFLFILMTLGASAWHLVYFFFVQSTPCTKCSLQLVIVLIQCL